MSEVQEDWGQAEWLIHRTVAVSGAPPMELHYWKDRRIAPKRVRVAFVRIGDEDWELTSVKVSGPVILKGERESSNRSSENSWRKESQDMPGWLTDIISRAWPGSD